MDVAATPAHLRGALTIGRPFDRLAAEWWLVLVASAVALAGCIALDLTARLDNGFYDFVLRGASPRLDPRILLVTVDDRSLAEVGAWPWSRDRYARILDQLHGGGARAVALDLLLVQPGAGDEALAQAIGRDSPVFLPVGFDVPGPDGASHAVEWPLPRFRASAAGLGHVNLAFDADGTVRRSFLTYRESAGPSSRDWPQLSSLLVGATPVRGDAGPLPGAGLEARDPAMIAYAGSQGSFPTVSAAAVLRGEVPAAVLRGRLVLVGTAASGLGDSYATPVGSDGSLMPGIEIQANLLNALLTGTVITPVSGMALYLVWLVPLVLLLLAMRALSPRWTLPAIVALLLGSAGLSAVLLRLGHLWLAPGSALVGILALYPFWTWRRLAAVSTYMSRELEKLDAEHDPLERPRPDLARADVVGRQMGLLRSAIDREHDLRRFLVDRIEQMPDSVLVTDCAGRVVLANAGARQLHAELEAEPVSGAGPANAEDVLSRLLREGAQGDEAPSPLPPIREMQVPAGFCAHDATGRTYDVRIEPQRSATGEPIGAVIRIADTTAATLMRRQREDVLQLLSHDMRSPQASILALVEQAGAGTIDARLAAGIRSLARRTLAMADDFVHLSRAELAPIAAQEVDIVAIAQDAAEALWPQARARGIALRTKLPDEALFVRGDASLLGRALANLLDNALKFGPSGSLVSLELGPGDTPGPGRWVACQVCDEGPGIPPEHLDLIFERFRRAPSGPLREVGGTGLGLAFVHTVAARHGGRVCCESDPGRGARFTLELPLIADPMAERDPHEFWETPA